MTVDRMRKRHGNINNEILMEKRVSSRVHYMLHIVLFSLACDCVSASYL